MPDRLRKDTGAVEPAIGVLLMVAIVVILALGMWYTWERFAGDSIQDVPRVAADAADADAPLTAATDDALVDITSRQGSDCVNGEELDFVLRPAGGGSEVPVTWTAPDEWCPGDVITLLEDGADASAGDHDVTVTHTGRNAVLVNLAVTLA